MVVAWRGGRYDFCWSEVSCWWGERKKPERAHRDSDIAEPARFLGPYHFLGSMREVVVWVSQSHSSIFKTGPYPTTVPLWPFSQTLVNNPLLWPQIVPILSFHRPLLYTAESSGCSRQYSCFCQFWCLPRRMPGYKNGFTTRFQQLTQVTCYATHWLCKVRVWYCSLCC